jgi:prevent-host-death family protein
MAYTVHQAKTHFSRLLKEAEAGEEVIVMRGDKPVAKLVPIAEPAPESEFRRIGGFEGLIQFEDHVFDPLTDEEMIEYGFDNPEKDARLQEAMGSHTSSVKKVG